MDKNSYCNGNYYIVILMIVNKSAIYKEGFVQREKYILKKQGTDIYDDFYSSIYDELFMIMLKMILKLVK